jgi:hypothetical protein
LVRVLFGVQGKKFHCYGSKIERASM